MTSGISYFYHRRCFSAFPLPCRASGATVRDKKDDELSQHRARNESFNLKEVGSSKVTVLKRVRVDFKCLWRNMLSEKFVELAPTSYFFLML